MDLPAFLLIILGLLGMVALVIVALTGVYGNGGLKLFIWPKLRHGYEVTPVARLAATPWALLLCALAGNGLVIALFGHDVLGRPNGLAWPWLVAATVPALLAHLIDYRRSVAAAVLGLVLLGALSAGLIYLTGAWVMLPLALLGLLWSLNGVRALHADRSIG